MICLQLNIIINGQGPELPDSMYVSGGTKRLLEIMKRISGEKSVKLYVVSLKRRLHHLYEKWYKRELQSFTLFLKNASSSFSHFLDSAFRIIRVNFSILPTEKGILYSPSDFLWDVFPAFVWKLRGGNKNYTWVQNIFHLIPPPVQRGGSFITNLASFSAQRLSFHLIRQSADLIFVLNDMIRDQLVKLGFSKNKIFVTGAGIDLSQIDEIQPAETTYDACFLGRLQLSKGIFDLIEIWKLVVSKKKNARLAIIYAGPKDLESS